MSHSSSAATQFCLLEVLIFSVPAPGPALPHKASYSFSLCHSQWSPALASSLDRGGMAHTWEQEPRPLMGLV